MDRSFRGRQTSGTQETSKSFLASLRFLASLITWLAGLIELTEEEQEEAGICLGRQGDE
jgi:hypothetical protein